MRRTRDWIELGTGSETDSIVRKLIVSDYTLEDAKSYAGESISSFLHYVRVLAMKRGIFFRNSSPIRYMMDCLAEEIQLLDTLTNVGNVHRLALERSTPTLFRKTSMSQDRHEQRKRKREKSMMKSSHAHSRRISARNRLYIREMRAKVKAYEGRLRRNRTILRVSKRFENSCRGWTYTQREELAVKMRQVASDRKRFDRMRNVIIFYAGGDSSWGRDFIGYCDPHKWTVQTCRHVSHVIR